MKTTCLYIMSGMLATVLITLAAFQAIAGDKQSETTSTTTAATTTESTASQKQIKGGSQLWSENCARCHNMRSPSSYSDAEWDVVMHHMRIRAILTPEEHKKILEFLKSAN